MIGADGLHSAVRKLAFGAQEQFEHYLGYDVAAVEVAATGRATRTSLSATPCRASRSARFAMRDDRTVFLFVFAARRKPRDAHDTAAHKALLHAEFGERGWECPQILAAVDAGDDIYFDRVSQIQMPRWTKGRVALIGDAAFCPSLLAGQGSALAMIAAYVLAGELGKSPEDAARGVRALRRHAAAVHHRQADSGQRNLQAHLRRARRSGLFFRNQVTKLFDLPFVASSRSAAT